MEHLHHSTNDTDSLTAINSIDQQFVAAREDYHPSPIMLMEQLLILTDLHLVTACLWQLKAP